MINIDEFEIITSNLFGLLKMDLVIFNLFNEWKSSINNINVVET